MYGIKANVEISVLAPDQELTADNLRPHRTREFRVFDKEELVLDPSRRNPHCQHSASPGFAGTLAADGHYGFCDALNGWTMIVHASHVEYDGVPVLRGANATTDRPAVGESNGLVDGAAYHAQFKNAPRVPWTRKGLRITRLRLLSDPGHPEWDVSYCHGLLKGKPVAVELPFNFLRKGNIVGDIIRHARLDNVFAKRLGILDAVSKLS